MSVAAIRTRTAIAEQPRPEVLPSPVRIAGLGSATPPIRVDIEELAAAIPMIWPHLGRRIRQLLPQAEGVGRHLSRRPAEMVTPLPLDEQTSRYRSLALDLAERSARLALEAAGVAPRDVGLVVAVSCTGFILPGLDVRLIPRLGLRTDLTRMPFSQFGCAGGAAGVARAADWLRGHPGEVALVVAVELPSVTFRPGDVSIDNLLSALVFGDGAAAAVLVGEGGGLSVGRLGSSVVPHTVDALGYELADDGFRVILSRHLPAMLEAHLPAIVEDFLGGVAPRALDVVAAHPGGPSILAAVERCLGLRAAQLAASRSTLRRSGNTSSAAILTVLEELVGTLPADQGSGLVLAFGPGLSVEMLELTWRC